MIAEQPDTKPSGEDTPEERSTQAGLAAGSPPIMADETSKGSGHTEFDAIKISARIDELVRESMLSLRKDHESLKMIVMSLVVETIVHFDDSHSVMRRILDTSIELAKNAEFSDKSTAEEWRDDMIRGINNVLAPLIEATESQERGEKP